MGGQELGGVKDKPSHLQTLFCQNLAFLEINLPIFLPFACLIGTFSFLNSLPKIFHTSVNSPNHETAS